MPNKIALRSFHALVKDTEYSLHLFPNRDVGSFFAELQLDREILGPFFFSRSCKQLILALIQHRRLLSARQLPFNLIVHENQTTSVLGVLTYGRIPGRSVNLLGRAANEYHHGAFRIILQLFLLRKEQMMQRPTSCYGHLMLWPINGNYAARKTVIGLQTIATTQDRIKIWTKRGLQRS